MLPILWRGGGGGDSNISPKCQVMKRFIGFRFVNYEETLNFGTNKENRQCSDTHLRHITKQCVESFDIMPPITVNVTTNNVIDGQHRLKAYQTLIENGTFGKEKEIKVMFVAIPYDKEKESIINANTNSRNWRLIDYVDSYKNGGSDDYVKLYEWCDMHCLCNENGKPKLKYAVAIIKGVNDFNSIKYGGLALTDDELKKGETIHDEILEIIKILGLRMSGHYIMSLALSWNGVRELHEFSVWIKYMKHLKRKIAPLPSVTKAEWDNIFGFVHLQIEKKGGEK